MSGSFAIESGQMVVRKDDRVVLSTSGTLVNFLPQKTNIVQQIVFPNFDLDFLYHWEFQSDYRQIPDRVYGWAAYAQAAVTAIPQEYEVEVPVIAVPVGADIFWGSVTLTRTQAPATPWLGVSITPLVPVGVSIPMTGTMLVEAGFGMARALSFYIQGGFLIARIEQSVSVAPGGYGTYGTGVKSNEDSAGGWNWSSTYQPNFPGTGPTNPARNGLPVYDPATAPYVVAGSGTIAANAAGQPTPSAAVFTYSYGQPNGAAIPSANYQSVYSVNITGRFGRRS